MIDYGQNRHKNMTPIRVTKDGALLMLSYQNALLDGTITGASKLNKFGQNSSVGTTYEDIADYTPDYSISSAQPMEILSDSANDTDGGSGANKVTIEGIDGNGALQTEEVTLNGTTPVSLSNQYLWINFAYTTKVGSGGSNAGVITIRTTSGATPATTTFGYIAAGQGRTLQTVYYTPTDYVGGVLTKWSNGVGKGQDCDARIQIRGNALGIGSGDDTGWRTLDIKRMYQNHDTFVLDENIQPHDIIRVQAKTSAGGIAVASRFNGYLHNH